MTILSQLNSHNNIVYFTPRLSAGFANNARALRGLVAFCLVYNKPLRSIINNIVSCSSMEQLLSSYGQLFKTTSSSEKYNIKNRL